MSSTISERINYLEGRLESYAWLGYLIKNLGDFNKSLEYNYKALKLAKEIGNKQSIAATLNEIGVAHYYQGDYPKALEFYRKSLKIREEIGNKKDVAISLNNIGVIYYFQGNISQTLKYYLKALKVNEEINYIEGIASSLGNIGLIYENQGDIHKALEYYQKSLKLEEEIGNKSGIATCLLQIGVIYDNQADVTKALEFYHKSLKINEEIGNKKQIATVLNNIGYVYGNNNDLPKALNYLFKSLKIEEEIGSKQTIATTLHNIGSIYDNQGNSPKALEYFHMSLKMLEELGSKIGITNALNRISISYVNIGDTSSAIKYARKSYNISKELRFPTKQRHAAKLMQTIAIVQGNAAYNIENNVLASNMFKKSDLFAQEIIDINNKAILSNFSVLSEKSQEKYFRTVAPSYMEFNSYALMRKQENPQIVNQVFNNTIKNKGLLLKSSTAMRNAVLTSKDTLLIDNYYKWIHLKKKIAKLYSKGEDTKELEDQASEFEKELVKGSQLFSDFKKVQNITWQDVQKGLKSNEAAIEFVHFKFKDYKNDRFDKFTDTTLYCALIVTATCKSPAMIPLFNEKDLEAVLGKFGGNNLNYINRIYGKNKEVKTDLYNLIWKPLEDDLKGVKKVYVSPSGLLHKVSFAAIAKEQNVYLCDNYDIELKSSTGKITESSGSSFTKNFNEFSATLFGGINYDTDSTQTRIWSYLRGTKSETEEIDKILKEGHVKDNYYSNTSATEEQFKLMASNSNIIHIATHGFFYPDPKAIQKNEEKNIEHGDVIFRGGSKGFGVAAFVNNPNPMMRSGLVFAGANDVWSQENKDDKEDGVLTAQEVAHIDMRNTQLVVMSACETGLEDIKGSEGVYGLQRAFKMAGVDYMIMSLWQVPDKETKEFMTLFYKKLLKQKDIKKAFSNTQREMREKYDPYYWAAFVLIE